MVTSQSSSPLGMVTATGAATLAVDLLAARYRAVRDATVRLTAPLAAEDQVVQVSPETSPTKWHLGHTTWFFERFCLREHYRGYQSVDDRYDFLFNSYYYTVGEMHRRADRGLLSRPTVAQVVEYRARVDDAIETLLNERGDDPELASLVTLGLHHEQQHQELLLTDVKQVLFVNPLGPAYDALPCPPSDGAARMELAAPQRRSTEIGAAGRDFCFDNETPRHRVLLERLRFGIAARHERRVSGVHPRRGLSNAEPMARRWLDEDPRARLGPAAVLVGGSRAGVHARRLARAR